MEAVVPFGKYKGQPVEVLANDRSYLDWLQGQSWFRERYPDLHTIVINNFVQPSETPDHNALQVRFLDDEFCSSFSKIVHNTDREVRVYKREFEVRGVDVVLQVQYRTTLEEQEQEKFDMKWHNHIPDWKPSQWGFFREVGIELKPSIGDDYPSILRQMKSNKSSVLLVREYTGLGATRDQFVETFRLSGIKVLFEGDVE